MFENVELSTTENTDMPTRIPDLELPADEKSTISDETQKLQISTQVRVPQIAETSLPPQVEYTKQAVNEKARPPKFTKRDVTNARMLQELCRKLCLSVFSREHAPARSLGFTSSIGGEGKSFLALTTARVLAHDSVDPVTLIECNWEHPSLHEYFGIPSSPGLAEWLRGTCTEADVRHQVDHNLTVIPAGNGSQDAVKLLKRIQQDGLLNTFTNANELYIIDLPPIITTGYGSLAASLVESLVVVVRTQVIPSNMVTETIEQLKELPIHGIILNQEVSRIPNWLRKIL